MGNLKAKMGQYAEARAYHERSIRIIEASMGTQHALLAKPLSSLASLLHVTGAETAAAWALAERAYRIRVRALGDSHPEVADSAATLGVLHLAAGNVERSLEWHRRSHALWSSVYGPNHPQVAMALSNIAAVYAAQAKFPQALQARQQCLLIERRSLGDTHPQVAGLTTVSPPI
jgi:tetratricopeptide (TPR) repeat protein